ncbi:hypothetical protein N0V83_002514 [Neocucurbitaria cava]|uniref:Glutathione S-transferase n=1 Tax=Neocucurbitaria cava TaxID=798079 RepID=A0A9W8YBP1_9PLEO|nr:hypothetical protein N0V83_002514 [Neocucurbitaria cava]
MPPITLYFLQASRSIRTAWLLEELNLDYTVQFSDRVNQKAPEEFKAASGNPLGKSPMIRDGDLTVYESGVISESGKVLPLDRAQRVKVRQWVHAAEATFMLHSLAILYARWNIPSDAPSGTVEAAEKGMSTNVQNDLAWLENELSSSSSSSGKFLCGESVTAADIMMQFSADFILARELGTKGKEYPAIRKWLEVCKGTEGYKRAVEKTGHKL